MRVFEFALAVSPIAFVLVGILAFKKPAMKVAPLALLWTLALAFTYFNVGGLTFKENDVTDATSIANSRALGKCLAIVAQQLGVDFIDAAQYIKPSKVDGVHLDEAGHAKMAELVYEKLQSMLS